MNVPDSFKEMTAQIKKFDLQIERSIRMEAFKISTASLSVGSSTITGWKRRSSAASFSIYLRYSAMVVATQAAELRKAQDELIKKYDKAVSKYEKNQEEKSSP